MPSIVVTLPPYPFVPPLPGVPPLLTPIGGFNFIPPTLSFGDTFGLPTLSTSAQWGIWDFSGSPLLVTDAVFSVEYARDYRVSDYPQQSGAFQSYNKVQEPFQARVTFLISESRFEFLQNIEAAVASLDLVTVITPEIHYESANLVHYSFRREAMQGVTLIKVEVWCEEIRETAGSALSSSTAAQPGSGTPNAQSPNAQPQSNSGAVQPSTNYTTQQGTFPTNNLTPPGGF